MRYSIIGAEVQQVRSVGGIDIKEARRTGVIFATLSQAQADKLKAMGFQVIGVGGVSAAVIPPIVTPPEPVAAAPTYSPEQLALASGYDVIKEATDPPLYGQGFNLAIIDTGMRETHEKLRGRVVYRKNYTSDPMMDGFNHGTGVCSIVLAVAPMCNILNLKTLDNDGVGTEEEVVLAIDDCIDLYDTDPTIAPSVINLSLGSPDDGNPNNPMRVACRAALAKGIWVVAAAGNEGPTPGSIMSPACEKYVGAVGSLSYDPFSVSSWSGRGPTREGHIKPDMVMFGEDIVMASSESDTATVAKSGTSFALPFMSGLSLLYHEGVYRQVLVTRQLVELPAGEIFFVTGEELLDVYLPLLCVKPEGVVAGKDDSYGYGLPYGPFVRQALGLAPTAAIDIGALIGPMMTIMMMGMIMPMMAGGEGIALG